MFFKEATNLRDGSLSYSRARVPFRAGARLGLALAQMFMAVFSGVLLIDTGLNRYTLISVSLTTLFTIASRVLFHGGKRATRQSDQEKEQ
jgi:hypothetical protein